MQISYSIWFLSNLYCLSAVTSVEVRVVDSYFVSEYFLYNPQLFKKNTIGSRYQEEIENTSYMHTHLLITTVVPHHWNPSSCSCCTVTFIKEGQI